VQLLLDRAAENLAAGNRNATRQRVKLGAKRGGTLTAIDARTEQLLRRTNLGPAVAFRAPGHARIVLSGVGPIPWRAAAAEAALAGAPADEDSFERAAGLALQGATPLRHNGYKVPLARALLKRALRIVAA
jgi:xanthine dehydrogenase YagS FAD-binding subunit